MRRISICPLFAAALAITAWPAIRVSDFLADVASSVQLRSTVAPAIYFLESDLVAQGAIPKSASSAAKPKPAARPDTSLHGVWRVSRGVIAPWIAKGDKSWDTKSWVGQTIKFDATHVAGPESLKCADAHYEATNFPADAIFQGGLKEPVKEAAQSLGFAKFPVAGTSLNCEAGLYEFHKLDATTEVVAINNVIWTLDRSPGALAAATTPAGVVQRFLEAHFAGDMGFDRKTVAAKQKFLTPALLQQTTKYFAKPVVKDEVPDINGDPFTDTQEYPTRFSVSAPTTTATSASVRVRFSDAFSTRNVTYLLRLDAGTWRVDDVKYDEGPTFRALLGGTTK